MTIKKYNQCPACHSSMSSSISIGTGKVSEFCRCKTKFWQSDSSFGFVTDDFYIYVNNSEIEIANKTTQEFLAKISYFEIDFTKLNDLNEKIKGMIAFV